MRLINESRTSSTRQEFRATGPKGARELSRRLAALSHVAATLNGFPRFAACLSLAFLLACTPRTVRADPCDPEAGLPFIRNYTPREYEAYTTTHTVVQDEQGVIYVATRGCVLEYDGTIWKKIPVGDPGSTVWCLAIQPGTGRIFVGGTSELGTLEKAPGGGHVYVSLLDRLPADGRAFLRTGSIAAYADEVYFVGTNQVMRWRDGRFEVEKSAGRIAFTACVEGRLYVQDTRGLMVFDNGTLNVLTADPVLAKMRVTGLLPWHDDTLLLASYSNGLFTLHQGALTHLDGTTSERCQTHKVRVLARRRDGTLLVATASDGVLVLDDDLRFRTRWNADGGLQNDQVWNVFEDAESGVWLSLDVGVSRVETPPGLSLFNVENGLGRQLVHRVTRLDGALTVVADSGLYRLRPSDPVAMTTSQFEKLPGDVVNCWGFCQTDAGMLVYGINGIGRLDGATVVPLRPAPQPPVLYVCRSRLHPERIYLGQQNGVTSLRWEPSSGKWIEEGTLPAAQDETRNIIENDDGSLWICTSHQGLFRVALRFGQGDSSREVARAVSFFKEPGPLMGVGAVSGARTGDGRFLAEANDKFYRFDEARGQFVAATEYGEALAGGALPIANFQEDDEGFYAFGQSLDPANTWQTAEWVTPARDGRPAVLRPLPAKIADRIGRIDFVNRDRDGVVLISGSEGVARLDRRRWLAALEPPPLQTLLRRSFATSGNDRDVGPQPLTDAALPYARHAVHFDYAATRFAAGPRPRYQTRLTGPGGGGGWSGFSERTTADYTNLPEGGYLFEVRASDADGRPGSVASLSFRIEPPWQRTWWAYTGYALGALFGVAALVRWRSGRLRAQNARLESLIESRTGELAHARDAAESANRAKSAFLANMTHELRTPLNAILGYSQILLKDPELSPRNRERITTMDSSGTHLLSMINEVLDLSKIEAGKLTLLPTNFSLEALLDDLCAAFRPRFAEKRLAFEHVRAPGLPTVVHTDAGKLRQVLFNLLGNALKFTRQGTVRLEVAPGETADTVRFGVVDTGVGIAPDELNHVFAAFHQAGEPHAAVQGTGLGLSISQRLVGLLGGRLQAESDPGKGSRFWFELPLPPVPVAGDLLTASLASSPSASIVGYHGPARRLLIVDDEAVNRRVLIELLAPLGFETEEAASGKECLARCAARPPDALLLDLRMGQLGGLEVARTLRRSGGTAAAVRIVAVSASVFADDRQQAIDAGCDDFLPKPFREEQLLEVLGRLLGLEWIVAEAADRSPIPDAASDPAGFYRAIDELIDLARNGDILGLKTRFAALRSADGVPTQHEPLARRLESLLAGYEIDRVHDLLVDFKTHAHE